jgi:CubicO group peptidase (beta-lactamase class C family)
MTDRLEQDVDPDEVGFDPQRLARVDAHFRRYVDDGRLPGWSLVIGRAGRVAHVARYGRRDVEADLPVEHDTVFRIYSMTKPITSVAAMMLYEQGGFELTDPIERYLPEFADTRVYASGSDLRPVTVPATEPIRVWHLLTHTAGLTYGFHRMTPVDAMYRARGYEWGAPADTDLAGAVRAWAGLPLQFQPGSEWNYSVATDVLGRLVEVASGEPLDVFFRDRILGPLGMSDTSFDAAGRTDRLAALYTPRPGGGLVRNDTLGATCVNPSWLSGGGGLVSTLRDYHRFTRFLLGGGELDGVRLLGSRTLRYMTRNHLPGGADIDTFGRPVFAEAPLAGVGFGLGFAVVLDPAVTHVLGTAGEFNWGGAASTAFWVDPVEEITGVFLTQLLPSSTYPIRSQLKQLVYAALVD